MERNIVLSLTALLILIACDAGFSLIAKNDDAASLVNVNYYVMSKCPYAQEYVLDFQQTVMAATGLPSIINLTMDYIATVDPTQPSGFSSKHGPTEVIGDLTELCVMNYAKSTFTWWSYLVCVDNNYEDIPDNSEDCATQTGVDWSQISQCVNASLGSSLMTASIERTDSLGWNPRPGSPTVYINGKCVYGYPPCESLDPSSNAVLKLICKSYKGVKPSGCTTSGISDNNPNEEQLIN